MARKIIPSKAQAQLIAAVWSGWRPAVLLWTRPNVDGTSPFNDPTTLVCIRHGWLVPIAAEEGGRIPHGLSDTAPDALEDYLRAARYKRGI